MELSTPIIDEQENLNQEDFGSDEMNALHKKDVENLKEKPLSKKEERELKLAYARALEQRKDAVKRNKELVADKQLEVAYWRAEADLLRHRFEKMDFYLKNLEIEPKYLQAVEHQKELHEQNLVNSQENKISD